MIKLYILAILSKILFNYIKYSVINLFSLNKDNLK